LWYDISSHPKPSETSHTAESSAVPNEDICNLPLE
jgi:hypothetical protein